MGFTDLTFTQSQKLTSTILAQLDQNFDALAEGDTSGPRIPRPIKWIQFCGFTDANAGVYVNNGISSFTRNDIGDYTINFTQAFSNTNYGMAISTISGFDYSDISVREANIYSFTSSSASIRYHAANAGANAQEDQHSVWCVFYQF